MCLVMWSACCKVHQLKVVSGDYTTGARGCVERFAAFKRSLLCSFSVWGVYSKIFLKKNKKTTFFSNFRLL